MTLAEKYAHKALRNAQTRAGKKPDPAAAYATLLAGTLTAKAWLNGTHPELAKVTARGY